MLFKPEKSDEKGMKERKKILGKLSCSPML